MRSNLPAVTSGTRSSWSLPPVQRGALTAQNLSTFRRRFAPGGMLVDKVLRMPPLVSVKGATGSTRLPGVGHLAEAIAELPVRYTLREEVSEWCFKIVRSADAFLDPDNPLLRMPLPQFWLEFPQEESGLKMGLLIRSHACGRSGTITSWWEAPSGIPDINIAEIEFDLDSPPSNRDGIGLRHSFRNADVPQLDELLSHAVATLDPSWAVHLASQGAGELQAWVRSAVARAWYALPMALAFATVLQSATPLALRPSDRGPSTQVESRRRRPGQGRQLTHVQVTLDLGQGEAVVDDHHNDHGSSRRSPRLHQVRGHVVNRNGKRFWRAPHLRGDASKLTVRRDVTVRL